MQILAVLNVCCYFHISISHFCDTNPGAYASSFIEMEADISVSTKNPIQVWLSSLLHCFNTGGNVFAVSSYVLADCQIFNMVEKHSSYNH